MFRVNGELAGTCFTPVGSGPQRLRLPEPKQREPMRMLVICHQLLRTFAHTLRNPAAQEGAMVQEERKRLGTAP